MYLVFDFLKNGLSGVVSYNHLYFSPPLSNFKGGSFEPFEPPPPPSYAPAFSLFMASKVNLEFLLGELELLLYNSAFVVTDGLQAVLLVSVGGNGPRHLSDRSQFKLSYFMLC